MTLAYRCYGMLDSRGRWRAWRFGPATSDVQSRLAAKAARDGQVAFASIQTFSAPRGGAGLTRWREVRQQYTGEGPLPHLAPLYFDVDAEGDLDKALLWARTLVEFFVEQLGLPQQTVRVWFSGSKGAHILVDATALGIEPGAMLTADMKTVALELVGQLAADSAADLSVDAAVYSLPRMLRLPDQANPRSGLYKVELSHHELFQLAADQVTDLARMPRGSIWTDNDVPDRPVPTAAAWWSAALARARKPREFRIKTAHVAGLKVRPDGYLIDELADASMPPCITGILDALVCTGNRNRCELQIACWARAAKLSSDKALPLLAAWTKQNRPELSPQNAEAKAASIVTSVYANAMYGFSCMAARAAVRGAGVVPQCDLCQAVRPHSLRQVFSLRVHHDAQWNPPLRIPLENARGLIARTVDNRIAACSADRAGNSAARRRKDPRRPCRPGRPRNEGRLCSAYARAGNADRRRPPDPRCQDALLAAGTKR